MTHLLSAKEVLTEKNILILENEIGEEVIKKLNSRILDELRSSNSVFTFEINSGGSNKIFTIVTLLQLKKYKIYSTGYYSSLDPEYSGGCEVITFGF